MEQGIRFGELNTSAVSCPCCGTGLETIRDVGTLSFYAKHGSVVTPIHRCGRCGAYWRTLCTTMRAEDHFELSSYTDPVHEAVFLSARVPFFQQLLALAEKHITSTRMPRSLLDVGCAYGHMMAIFRDHGWECAGIEVVRALRDNLNASQQARVFEDLPAVPQGTTYDAITMIDSLYYFTDPCAVLSNVRELLEDGGVVLVRIANRAPLLNIALKLRPHRVSPSLFGDQLVVITDKAMKQMAMKSGLKVVTTIYREEKPQRIQRDWRRWIYYRILPLAANLTHWPLTPGIVYVLAKDSC